MALFFLSACSLFAQTAPSYDKPTGFVSDFAHVLDAPQSKAIEDQAASLQRVTGIEAAIVTIPTLNGEPIEDFANSLYRKWGIGQKGKNEGFLLLLAVQDHKVRVEVGYGLEPILTDGYVGGVQRSIRTELRDQKYGEAIRKVIDAFGTKISQSKETLESQPGGITDQQDFPLWVFLTIAGFVVVGVLIPIFREARSLFQANRGSWRSGGGFGGASSYATSDWGSSSSGTSSSDSGGSSSFGGFGGGDSGGGGASSDW